MTTLTSTTTPTIICKNFMYNNCQRTNCKFIHDNNICFYFWKFGSCKRESDCNKSHVFTNSNDKNSNDKNSNDKNSNDKNSVENGSNKEGGEIDKKVKQKNNKNKDKYDKELRKNLKNNKKKHVKNTECFDPMTKPVDVRISYDLGKTNVSSKFVDECKKSHKYNKEVDKQKRPPRKRNTECFEPMTKPVDLRVVLDLRSTCNYNEPIPELTSRDVLLSPKLFDDFDKYEIYNKLSSEIENCGIPEEQLLKMWHGNDKIEGTHLIADDHRKWKENCPTFNMVISRLKEVFKMDIKATRLNWYRDPDHFKPFHKDSSAINPDRALTQNFTVAVSFGVTKDAAFEHAKTKTVISMPQPDGTIYSFTNDTNCIWRHGILQDKNHQKLGRISVIAWGWIDNVKQIS
jgi:hypothetical protein